MQSIFRHPFSTRRRRWGISLAVATVAVALFVLIPFSYEYTAGTRLTISSADPAFARIDGETLRAALGASPIPVRNIQRNSDGATHSLTFLVEGSREQALAALSAVRNLIPAGLVSEVSVEPWRVRESGSLLAQIASRLIDIRLDVAGKSDAELTEDVRSQLTAQGFAPSQVNVTKSEKDGGTSVQMTFSGDVPEGGGQIEVKTELVGVPEGEGSVAKIIMTDPNLTDAEKAAEIKRRLAEQGIDADVKVENGEVKVQAVRKR